MSATRQVPMHIDVMTEAYRYAKSAIRVFQQDPDRMLYFTYEPESGLVNENRQHSERVTERVPNEFELWPLMYWLADRLQWCEYLVRTRGTA